MESKISKHGIQGFFFHFFYFLKYNVGFFIFSLVFFFCYYQVEQGQFGLIIIINIV